MQQSKKQQMQSWSFFCSHEISEIFGNKKWTESFFGTKKRWEAAEMLADASIVPAFIRLGAKVKETGWRCFAGNWPASWRLAPEEIRRSSKKPVDVRFEISMFFFLEGVNYFKRNKYFGFSLHWPYNITFQRCVWRSASVQGCSAVKHENFTLQSGLVKSYMAPPPPPQSQSQSPPASSSSYHCDHHYDHHHHHHHHHHQLRHCLTTEVCVVPRWVLDAWWDSRWCYQKLWWWDKSPSSQQAGGTVDSSDVRSVEISP